MNEFNLPVFSFPVTLLIMIVVMLGRYFFLAGLSYQLAKKFPERSIEKVEVPRQQILKDIKWSVYSTLIFALSGAWLIQLWQQGSIDIYKEADKYGWMYFIISLPLLMFIHDMYFYWSHRLLHLNLFFKRFHLVHHQSRVPTAWTAFSFHPVEAILQALILPVLLLLFPTHWLVVISFLTLMSILGIINHLGHEFYSQKFRTMKPFTWLISATHHQAHHRQIHHNFGLYFNWWDLWMKTEARAK